MGSLPADWELVYSGGGESYQEVSNRTAYSGENSFQLWGRSSWSAVAQRRFDTESPVIGCRFAMMIAGKGWQHEEHPAFFKFRGEDYWGTYYAAVRFDNISQTIKAEDDTVLGHWSPGIWYTVTTSVYLQLSLMCLT